MKRYLLLLLVVTSLVSSTTFEDINLGENNKVFMQKGSYKVLRFQDIISKIKIHDDKNIDVSFTHTGYKPLQSIRIFAKEVGKTSMFITFDNGINYQIDCYITKDMAPIIDLAESIAPNIKIEQTKGKIILKGSTPNQRVKDQITDMFRKAGVVLENDLIDLATLENPDKMVRVKLYVVEINNDKGLALKNNWYLSSRNYMQSVDKDGLFSNASIDNVDSSNAQRNPTLTNAVDSLMASAVTLTGGLTGAANYLGKYFNVGATLNYLSSTGVANILDETTLVTLEEKESGFLAGGKVYVKMQTTTAEGLPVTEVKEIDYGLQLDIKVKNIVGERFVNLEIVTKSTDIDWTNTIDGIPSFTEKSVETNVISANQATIVLGGLITRSDSESIEKIPLLGDIPIIGKLFTSKDFKEGKSELVFFITPEIVDPKTNRQEAQFDETTYFRNKVDNKFSKAKEDRIKRLKKEQEEEAKKELEKKENKKSSAPVEKMKSNNKSSQELHEERIKQLYGN